jgi:chemotaxis protein CheD
MVTHVVGIGKCTVTSDVSAVLVTYSLGSCIGVAIYDPGVRVGGLLHFMLPDSKIDPEKAKRIPGMFADTGIPMLFKTAYGLGLEKRRARVVVAGGSAILDESRRFDIGKRNYLALRNLFWKNNVLITAEDVGGCESRTLYLNIATGEVRVSYASGEVKVLMQGDAKGDVAGMSIGTP